jgi:hypothetical protein
LVNEIEENGFTVDLITVEVGSRGFVKYESFCHLNELLGATQKELSNFLVEDVHPSVSPTCVEPHFGVNVYLFHARHCSFY